MRFLVKADDVSGWIGKPSGYLGSIHTHRLNDLTTVRNNFLNRNVDVVNHNIKQQPNLCHRLSVEDPRAANLADGIVKSCGAITALSDIPSEYFFIKQCRL